VTTEKGRTDDLVSRCAEALWREFNGGQERPLPPELRWDHERAARSVLREAGVVHPENAEAG
jgi:hypothetical protein